MSGKTPTSPDWLSLGDGERVRLTASPSRNLVLAALGVGFVLLIVMSVAVSSVMDLETGREVSFFVLLLIVGLLVAAFAFTHRSEYVLTTDRVCAGIGLGSKRVASLPVDEVNDVTIEQSSWQQLVNIGTLRFVTDGQDLAFSLVGHPAYLHQEVLQFVDVET